jgi:hypothetical protein
MATLRSAPYSLLQGTIVKAVIKAQNINGWSSFSFPNSTGALVEYVPAQMNTPTNGLTTNELQIQVNWAALTGVNTGGSTITSYNLQYDSGSAGYVWTNVLGIIPQFTGLTTVLSSNIVKGTTYQFRIRASNIHGWGPFSNVVSIKTATIPS